jgi:adenylate cyclase
MAGAQASAEVPPLPDKPSIAVLPFENMSGDPEQEYFADGMAEDIITALSRIDMLFVIARNSSFTYKGRAVDIRQVARELGVRYVLEGSVRRAGNRVRITGQLIEADSGAHLWADKFDGELEEIFDLQDRIAESVVGVLEPTLRSAEIERARRKRPENLDAYDLYLQAIPMVFSFRADENQRAIDLLDRAIGLDPKLAASLALKAWCMTQRIAAGWSVLTPEFQAEAVALARAAIAADDQHAIALATAGFALTAIGKDHPAGVAAVRRALDLNDNSAYICMHAGYVLNFDDQPEEAITLLERARRLSPIDPLNYHFLQGIAASQMVARRPQEAYEYGLRSVAENGNWNVSNRFLASACGHLGRIDEGKQYLSRIDTKDTISSLRAWIPYRSKETLEYFLDGLRKVGHSEE